MATAYHRCIAFTCTAVASDAPGIIAEGQNRIMRRYPPEGGYRELRAGDPLCDNGLEMLAAVRLTIEARRAKFKLAENRPAQTRRAIASQLRKRNRLMDERAAALEQSIEQD